MLATDKGAFREYANINGDFFRQIAQSKYVEVLRNGKKTRIKMPGDLDNAFDGKRTTSICRTIHSITH